MTGPTDLNPTKHLLLTRQLSDDAVHRPPRAPDLVRIRRGAYAPREAWAAARPEQRHRLLVLATVATMSVRPVVGYESAAVLLGIPVVGPLPEKVHVVEPTASGGRSSGLVVRHGTRVEPSCVTVDGVTVTSPARTVLDLSRARSFVSALAAADHVLAAGMASRTELEQGVEALRSMRGYRSARRVVANADSRSGSVGESVSRAQMHELRLPMPELQQVFVDDRGFVARTDFWWPQLRLVGEFDGRVKYQRDGYAGGRDPGEVVWQEKLREDRLRRMVRGVLRWTWADARDRKRFAALMARHGIVPGG